ncbi:MAG: SIR2 family NAD-dependent protein deacylase [Bacilli bacterium]
MMALAQQRVLPSDEHMLRCQALCKAASRLVAVTGAGLSVASGLPTVEADWSGRPLKELFRAGDARRHVREYQTLYRKLMTSWLSVKPNIGHMILAQRGARIITQNVDGLHQRAGSREIIELHGSLMRLRCRSCRSVTAASQRGVHSVQCRACGGQVWPDVVMEGEAVRSLTLAVNWISIADVLLVVGTSLEMDPVNRFPLMALRADIPVIVINEEAEFRLFEYLNEGADTGHDNLGKHGRRPSRARGDHSARMRRRTQEERT